MKRIGLLLKKPESVFSNGCVQQPLFLRKSLVNAGFEVDFLGTEKDYREFEFTRDPIVLTDSTTDFSAYACVVLASAVLVENENNAPYLRNMERYGVHIVSFICGNIYVLLQEEFVFSKHNIMAHYIQPYKHRNMIMEMYDYASEYLNVLSDTKTDVVPYVWDPDVIDSYVKSNQLLQRLGDDRSKINIMIWEPNMSIHKNAFVPLLICEDYYRRYGNLNKVYLVCCQDIQKKHPELTSRLRIFKDNRVESFGRIIMPYMMDTISRNNNYLSVTLSYTMLNSLNFLHLEMMYLGVPIVHNNEPFEKNGMYYKDYALRDGADRLEEVRNTFSKKDYMERCASILETYASCNTERVERYRSIFAEMMRTEEVPLSTLRTEEAPLSTLRTEETPLSTLRTEETSLSTLRTEEAPLSTLRTEETSLSTLRTEETSLSTLRTEETSTQSTRDIHAVPTPQNTASTKFYRGEGHVLLVRNSEDLNLARCVLRDWTKRGVFDVVEILHNNIDRALIREFARSHSNTNRIMRMIPFETKNPADTKQALRECSFKRYHHVCLRTYRTTRDISKSTTRSTQPAP